jgi:hypothetical protein
MPCRIIPIQKLLSDMCNKPAFGILQYCNSYLPNQSKWYPIKFYRSETTGNNSSSTDTSSTSSNSSSVNTSGTSSSKSTNNDEDCRHYAERSVAGDNVKRAQITNTKKSVSDEEVIEAIKNRCNEF